MLEKPFLLYPNVLKIWSFQRNCTGVWSFLYRYQKWYFFSPKMWSCSLGWKWKMIFLKRYMKIWYLLQMFWKNGLPKKLHWNMIFLLSSGNMAFLFPENMFFLQTKNKRPYFSKDTWKYDDFCMFGKDGISFSCKYKITLLSKKQRWSFPEKYNWRWHFQHYWKRWYSSKKRWYCHSRLTF